jgi:hypothetical protein
MARGTAPAPGGTIPPPPRFPEPITRMDYSGRRPFRFHPSRGHRSAVHCSAGADLGLTGQVSAPALWCPHDIGRVRRSRHHR